MKSQKIHGLQLRRLARTSLATKLMKHENSLESCETVHQISECLRPILEAVVSRLSARSCVVVVCRPSITAQIVVRVTAGLVPLEAIVNGLEANLENLEKISSA